MLSLIVAESENRVIGCRGELPWRLSSDLRRFKQLTMGHIMIMGRKTFESIGRLLPGRRTVVVTRQPDWTFPGVLVAHGLEEALRLAQHAGDEDAGQADIQDGGAAKPEHEHDYEVFVVGGSEIYRAALPQVERIYLTRVHAVVDGDTYFPELPADQWQVLCEEFHAASDRDDFDHTFVVLHRQAQGATRPVPNPDAP